LKEKKQPSLEQNKKVVMGNNESYEKGPQCIGKKGVNIILILADDLGYSDLGCYGSEIHTPNLDRLASGGVRFTQMYNCGRCCPSRASLLTGLYPHQAGIGWMNEDLGYPSYQGYLNNNCLTIAEALKIGGYHTLMVGKWHVGGRYFLKHPECWHPGTKGFPTPTSRGFDEFFGTLEGGGSYFNPYTLMRNETFIQPQGDDFYYTDAISENAVRMIDAYANSDKPFFLYVSYTAPHWPLHALPEDIARYEGKYRKGWDVIRAERHERLKAMGILSKKWPISLRDEQSPPWTEVKEKDWEDLRMAVYAAQIDRMDQGIGSIIKALKQNNIEKNTLIMFLSDNGGAADFLYKNGWVDQFCEEHTRKGEIIRVGNIPGLRPGPETTFMSYGLSWANVSNSPFRLFKGRIHEGGIATPFIAYWPEVIQAGSINHAPTHFIDIMPTLLDIAGINYPEEYNGNKLTPLEGESLLPAFYGKKWSRQKPLFWEHEGNCGVRQGRWKLVLKYPGPWELYDMIEDRTELNDLSRKNKPKVKELEAAYNIWAKRCGVIPWRILRKKII